MRFKFDTEYSEKEMEFLTENNCQILSEIKLSRTDFSKFGIPRRMFKYYGFYMGEVFDDETGEYLWGILSKWKGVYHFSSFYEDLESLEEEL